MNFDDKIELEYTDVMLIRLLLQTSSEHPLDFLEIDPHPSDYILALFSAAVYTEKEKEPRETDADYGKRLNLPEGWRLLTTGSSPHLTNGYFGVAFFNTELQQVVVAHRGTDLFNPGAVITDVLGIMCNQYTSCMNTAITFVDKIRQVIHSVNSSQGRCYNLAITGHSLGGWLAQVTAFTVKWVKASDGALKDCNNRVHPKTVVFESPGAKNILDKIRNDYFTNYGTIVLDRLDIKVYVSAPNIINTCGLHIGTIYRVFIDFSEYDWKNMNPGSYTLKTHDISNFVDAFEKSLSNIRKVLDWPKDIKEYNYIFKDLNNVMDSVGDPTKFDAANNYHVDIEKLRTKFLDGIKKHYHVLAPSDSLSMHQNGFSDDELRILQQFLIFQKHRSNLKILKDFFSGRNIERNDKILPDFEINPVNQTIECNSKQLLEDLTKILKQLVRYMREEFMEAVYKQIEAFDREVDSFYKDDGQIYLVSTPTSILDFKYDIGFNNFLCNSDNRVLCIVTRDVTFEMIRLRNIFSQMQQSNNLPPQYRAESYYTFLGWPRLHSLYNNFGSPIDQNNLIIVDASSSLVVNSEVHSFISNYENGFFPDYKKLVFVSSQSVEIPNNFVKTCEFTVDTEINLTNLCDESQKAMLQRIFYYIPDRRCSLEDFFENNLSDSQINNFFSSECVKNFATHNTNGIIIKDTRPRFSPLQQQNIRTGMECIERCVHSRNPLVVMSGLSQQDLDTEFILAREDIELLYCPLN